MKIAFTITSEEQREAVAAWLKTKGIDVASIDYDIQVAPIPAPPAPVLPPVSPIPPPVPPVPVPAPGHQVVWDPPLSATGNATMFGLNWDGGIEPADNGIGFFEDPITGNRTQPAQLPYGCKSSARNNAGNVWVSNGPVDLECRNAPGLGKVCGTGAGVRYRKQG